MRIPKFHQLWLPLRRWWFSDRRGAGSARWVSPGFEQLEERSNPAKFYDDGLLALQAEIRPGIAEPPVPVYFDGVLVGNANVVEGYQRVADTTSYPLAWVDIVASTYNRLTYQNPDGTSAALGTSLVGSVSFRTDAGLQLIPTVTRADISVNNDLVTVQLTAEFGSLASEIITYQHPLAAIGQTDLDGTITFQVNQPITLADALFGQDALRVLTVSTMFTGAAWDTNVVEHADPTGTLRQLQLSGTTGDSHFFAQPQPLNAAAPGFTALKELGSTWHPDSPTVQVNVTQASITYPGEASQTLTVGLQGYRTSSTDPNDDTVSLWLEALGTPSTLAAGTRLEVHYRERATPPALYRTPWLDFSPYILPGENPGNGPGQVTLEELTHRIEAVAPYTNGIRTFGCTGDLEPASQIIHALGKQTAIGAWLDADSQANQHEIDHLIQQALLGHVDVAIVGSETQYRHDLNNGGVSEETLLGYIQQVKTAFAAADLHIPVTTADTFEALRRHPNLLASVDVVYANFYPFWEGASIDVAVARLHAEYQQLQALVPDKEVVVSETGWPSDGLPQGAAVPTPENAARYFLNVVSWARANHVSYAYFEATDEPWKVEGNIGVGPHWGIFDTGLMLKSGMQAAFDGVTVPDNWTAPTEPGSIDFFTMPSTITTNLGTFLISGAVNIGATVAVNGVPLAAEEMDALGAFAHTVDLTAGNNTLTVTITDASGQQVKAATKTVILDTTFSTSSRELLYVDAVAPILDGTIVIDSAASLILGMLKGQHIRGVSPDGSELYLEDRTVLSTSHHETLRMLPFSQSIPVNGFLVSPTGDRLYSRNQVVEVATNMLLSPLPIDITTGTSYDHASIPGGPAISPDGSVILAGSPVVRIETRTGTVTPTGITQRAFLSDLALSPDGQLLFVSSYGGSGGVEIYDASNFQPMGGVGLGDFTGEIGFLAEGKVVLGNAGNPATGGGGVTVFDLAAQQGVQRIPIMLADNLTTSSAGDVLFVTTGDRLGVDEFVPGTDGQLVRGKTFVLGIQRYVSGTGHPENDQIRRLLVKPAVLPPLTLDVDGDGSVDPLTDGLLILRYLFGFTGSALTLDAIAPGATHTDPDAIRRYLERGLATMLDVDGNGRAEPLSDGLLILRYLFGFTGSALTQDALTPDAIRTEPGEIRTFLAGYHPAPGAALEVVELPAPSSRLGTGFLTEVPLRSVVREAGTDRTAVTGVMTLPAPQSVPVRVLPSPEQWLVSALGTSIPLGADAAGSGWFLARTPDDNFEFSTTLASELQALGNSPAWRSLDFLTVELDETGHALGGDDLSLVKEPCQLLTATMVSGFRRLLS